MRFLIENWGPIERAEIDLSKPLIVLTGPNGTGKTYMSYLVYGLVASFGFFPYLMMKKGNGQHIMSIFSADLIEKGKSVEVELNPSQLFQLFEDILTNKWKELVEFLNIDIPYKKLRISILSTEEEWAKGLFESELTMNSHELKILKPIDSYKCQIIPLSDNQLDFSMDLSFFLHYMFFEGINSPYMLTAERTGVYTFSKELSLGRLRYPENAGRYPMPISDSLANAEDLAKSRQKKSDYAYLADEIEKNILQGKMKITENGDIQYSFKRKKIPYNVTSSMVKTLSPIIFYLRHKADRNTLLMIDEPEINLHPNNQILLARVFARMINAGLHLMIATHSDYIIREINNMIMMSKKNAKVVKELLANGIYTEKDFIYPQDIGVYFFNYCTSDNKNVIAENLKVEEGGFSIKTIDTTIESQNKIMEDLFYGIKYGKK